MANGVRQDPQAAGRRQELARSPGRRRQFQARTPKQDLGARERPSWHLIAYGIVLVALLVIGGVAYTTYAFSKYHNEILPGTYIDSAYVGEMTSSQAENVVLAALQPVYEHPIELTYRQASQASLVWKPKPIDLGYQIYPQATVNSALQVGRHESFFEQLLDRLPIHPNHTVALVFTLKHRILDQYVASITHNRFVGRPMQNAYLRRSGTAFVVVPSRPGQRVDAAGTRNSIEQSLGTLSTPIKPIPIVDLAPHIGDTVAGQVKTKVNQFLAHPPVYSVGKNVSQMSRADLAQMISFQDVDTPKQREIKMIVDPIQVKSYVDRLASQYDRAPQDPKFAFDGSQVQVVTPGHAGKQVDAKRAFTKLLAAVTSLHAQAKIRLKVTKVQPPADETNPATLGISTLLGAGESAFPNAADKRTQDVLQIASTLDNTLIRPGQDISFNQLVGPSWDSSVYADSEVEQDGQIVPGPGGAMQQVATAFFRALFISGLQLIERHSHVYQLPWYNNPVGSDAMVSADGSDDLRFHNNTGKNLFIKTRVEPIRQEIYIYVYGPKLGWKVQFSTKVLHTQPHPPRRIELDPALSPGQVKHLAFAHDGLDVAFRRTVTYADGRSDTSVVRTHYQPWQAVVEMAAPPTITPTPTPTRKRATATPNASAATPTPSVSSTSTTPGPQPTATFNH